MLSLYSDVTATMALYVQVPWYFGKSTVYIPMEVQGQADKLHYTKN